MRTLILIGNPNVGKSAIFWRLTGIHATTSNYPGTTVAYKSGFARIHDEEYEVIDTPGSYSLEATNQAEQVTLDLIDKGDLFVNVVDATNLERNLLLTMQLLEQGLPVVVALNMSDEAAHTGIQIDVDALQQYLRVSVIPTVGISGVGVKELSVAVRDCVQRIESSEEFPSIRKHESAERWADIGALVGRVQNLQHRHHTFLERLQDLSLSPGTGLIIAVVLLFAAFRVVRFLGEGLIAVLFDPFFEALVRPLLTAVSNAIGGMPFLHQVVIGRLIDGEIDFMQSMGLLTTGLYVPLGAVLPYVLSFYLVLSLLEDVGYLPRLGVLLDGLMHKLGLHGFSVIPLLLGLGCNVPAILATRCLESKSQRFIACTLISIGVPCVSLQAMLFKLLGPFGFRCILAVYLFLAGVILVLGCILRRVVTGILPELILEIPPYRAPSFRLTLHKLYYRCRGFVLEAIPIILVGILVVSVLDGLGAFDALAALTAPAVTRVWGLPKEAVLPIVMGFFRKDIAAGMLLPLQLSPGQLMTAGVLLSLTFPCIASFVVMFSELGWKATLKSVGLMLVAALVFGGLANILFGAVAPHGPPTM